MNFNQKVVDLSLGLLKGAVKIIGRDKYKSAMILSQMSGKLIPIFSQETNLGKINFFCQGRTSVWRAQTLLTKEPETIEWLNTLNEGDVLWDIGANIGVYSLFAALKGLTVLSFEPSPGNYYLLCRNIEINRMNDRILSYCMAFNDISKLDIFYMANTDLGGARNNFGKAVDSKGNAFTSSLKQAMIGFSIDDFIKQFSPPFPNHIKIDVDGIEDRIIRGAQNTLADKRLKSVLIEIDSGSKEVFDLITGSGLKLYKKGPQPSFNDHTKSSNVCNHIFIR